MCDHGGNNPGCCCDGARETSSTGEKAFCSCVGNIPKHFILPAILVLLDEEPTHGYSLVGKLSDLGIISSEMSPASVYRILSKLEEDGLAVHKHVDDGQGPTRKVYMLTDEGKRAISDWREQIKHTRRILDWFINRASGK